MKEKSMEVQHHENDQRGAFIIPENGERLGELTYVWQGEDKFAIDHTWVSPAARGRGVARELLDAAVAYAREKQVKIIPVCSYVATMFQRETSFADVAV